MVVYISSPRKVIEIAKPRYRVTFDNELGIVGNITLQFASDGDSFIRPITKNAARASALKVMSQQNMVTPWLGGDINKMVGTISTQHHGCIKIA